MYLNKEIEFKSFISEDDYNSLLKEFGLENNIFKQINHYFDTDDLKLLKDMIVLRIREKGNNFKLTKKTRGDSGNDETHILLTKEKAQELLNNGFNADIIGLPYDVKLKAELTTYRCSTPYRNGTIFLDRSEYYGHVDYEIEFEVDDLDQGKEDFYRFLEKHNIPYKESIKKSKRAFDNKPKN